MRLVVIEDARKYERLVSKDVFAANFANLAKILAATKPEKPADSVRWKGGQPNKVWTSRVIKGPHWAAYELSKLAYVC